MKSILLSAVAAATVAGPALADPGPEVGIEHAVARVVVMVEDRADVGVEIQQGASRLPALRVERRGADVRISGGLGRRVAGFRAGDGIGDCRSGPDQTRPGQGASVEVRGLGRVNVDDAPLIVIRAPRDVRIDAGGAVYGSIGRGAASVELGNGGCGDWVVANSDGPVEVSSGGSGTMMVGTSRSLEVNLAGSGDVTAGATGRLEISLAGSGGAMVAEANGDVDISIAGSGETTIRRGRVPNMEIAIAGSGDIDFGGTAGDVSISIAGSGDVRVAEATGAVSRSVIGSGDIRIGR
ncbi:MAG: GIN domain-containing protein [Brevundimonas sp.]|uniref:GIN domain-containing protein n=1 Tax=Brevundimonas sp. TaxID=1871086 RepID=UPI00391B7EE2